MKRIAKLLSALLLATAILAAGIWVFTQFADYGFAREVSLQEQELRLQIVATAESRLGTKEGDETHLEILSIYNSHEPLAQGYTVT